ncbi:hypothetical protein ES702_02077 [subsurface metagenome]
MSAKNPRINVVLEKPIYKTIQKLATHDGVSLSLKARDLIREALEYSEDVWLGKIAEHREKTFPRKKALTHKKISSL